MLEDLNALAIMAFHDRQLANTGLPVSDWAEHTRGIWHWIELDHAHNRLLWAAQRKAECASGLTQPNDAVDDYREKRRNAQEAIDDCVLAGLRHVALRPGARVSSETVSSLIDRLSRLSLRIHRARENRCGEEELAR